MPNRLVFHGQPVEINADEVIVSTSGPATLESPLQVTGAIGVASIVSVEQREPTHVLMEDTLNISGALNLESGAIFEINQLPTLSVNEPISVTGTLALANDVVVQTYGTLTMIQGSGYTSILLTSIASLNFLASQTISTTPMDVSSYSSYGYVVFLTGGTFLTTFTLQPQVGPILDTNYFINSGGVKIPPEVGIAVAIKEVVYPIDLGKYSRIVVGSDSVVSGIALNIYFYGFY